MHHKPLVVILGGGYGGIRVARDLAKKKAAQIILIDRNPYHMLYAQFYEMATLFRPEQLPETNKQQRAENRELLTSAAIPLRDIFARMPMVKIEQGEVTSVDPEARAVIFDTGRKLHYDYLVVALGSKINYFSIPHLEQNSIGLKSVNEAGNIRNRIDELFLTTPKHKKITVVIGGGGFTGVELAGELVGYMKKLSRLHSRPTGNWACVVVEAGAGVLGTSAPWVQKRAARRLKDLGVTVLAGSAIVDVWPNLLYLGKEKRPFGFDFLIWTAGVKGACEGSIVKGVGVDKKMCLTADPNLRVSPYQNIFTVGDTASTLDKQTGAPMPMTAQKALHEGAYVSRAIRRLVKNPKATLVPYKPKPSKFIIPIGGKFALLEAGSMRWTGFFAWVLKYAVLIKYLITILPLGKSLRYTAHELRLFIRNDV
ncbi:MAG: NAD(P)/FAD-dependent oxidoreductase [Candidatus Ryanbacteria bacterium]|nr:NAD(P)/FAD-dependent oxidoreductase [Candidatus Ryanbacteria bacterium]